MNIDQAFPSNYLKAADLQGREANVRIDRVEMEDVGDDRKPVVYFQGKDRGIVLNKTNATNISEAYGKETGNWIGKPVTLFTAWVDFQGRSVEAIRIRPSREFVSGLAEAPKSQGFDERTPPPHTAAELSDDIPF